MLLLGSLADDTATGVTGGWIGNIYLKNTLSLHSSQLSIHQFPAEQEFAAE